MIEVGRIFPLGNGSWARVIRHAPEQSPTFPYLVRSIFLRSRWWVNECGEPNNSKSPKMIVR